MASTSSQVKEEGRERKSRVGVDEPKEKQAECVLYLISMSVGK